jgi:ubiquinone/menaquinone biosynthesis C-methylase UbiE
MAAPEAARSRYTHGHHASVLGSHARRTAGDSAAYLLPLLKPGFRLLDVGCGPGTITAGLARAVGGTAVGLEAVAAPLETARGSLEGIDRAALALGDVGSLPFADDSFDVVHAHQVLQHLTHPVGALREMARVCRPAGTVAARDADYAAMAWYPRLPGLDQWAELYQRVARSNGAEPDAGRHLRSWAEEAGLRDVQLGASAWCCATPEQVSWWAESWAQRSVASDFAQQAVERRLATLNDLEAIAEAFRAWGATPGALFLIPHVELLGSPA